MLHRHRDDVVGDDGSAGLGPLGDREELPCLAAVGALQGHGEQSVVGFQRVAVGGNPQVAVPVEGEVVGAGDGTHLRLVEAAVIRVGRGGVTAHQQQVPREGGAGVVVGDLDDLAV